MKRLLNLLSLIIFVGNIHAAIAPKQKVEQFFSSKTYIVMEGSPAAHNIYLKSAVEKYWTVTKYEFIDQTQFEAKRFEPGSSFLFVAKAEFDKQVGIYYRFLTLAMGDTTQDISLMPELCAFPLSYDDDNSVSYGLAMDAIIIFMQHHVKQLRDKYTLMKTFDLKYYQRNHTQVAGKTLLLCKEDLTEDIQSADKFLQTMFSTAEFLTYDQIEDRLKSSPQNTVFLFCINPIEGEMGRSYKIIFDAVNGTLYYYNFHFATTEYPAGFNAKDLQNFEK